ncbi:MAG: aminoglycoside phosphotransferase family protein [Geodermatophilaceae bacterium]|nr:aminoglycoside phosphotransferase family protein [Geodermatophilaceae bacterium]
MLTAVAQPTGFAPDPMVRSRDRLLDPVGTAAHLSALLGRAPANATLVRTKYRIAESLRVLYRLDDGPLVTGRAFASTEAAATAYQRALAAPGRPAVHDPELATVWWTFPDDRRLRTLAAVLNPDPVRLGLPHPGWTASELVEYAPERSATFRAADARGDTVGYVKAYAPGTVDVGGLARRYAAVAGVLTETPGGPVTPRPLGWAPTAGLLMLSPVPGLRWVDLPPDELPSTLHRLGAAFAAVHGIASPPGLSPFGRLRQSRLRTSAELVARARRDVADVVTELAARLADGPPPGEPPVVLHGDCHPKNALVDGEQIGLVDLDQAGTGPAAADLGSLLARLHVDELVGGPSAAPLAAAVSAGYAGVRPLPGDRSLQWHTAAALLAEQAMRAVNRVRLPVLDRLDALLDLAVAVLDGR